MSGEVKKAKWGWSYGCDKLDLGCVQIELSLGVKDYFACVYRDRSRLLRISNASQEDARKHAVRHARRLLTEALAALPEEEA